MQGFNFYPRSPCGERPASAFFIGSRSQFLSTLSLRRATATKSVQGANNQRFLSTLSLRRATISDAPSSAPYAISIHALLAESDLSLSFPLVVGSLFLSTLSLRRATARRASRQQPAGISIHALLAESDIVTAGLLMCNLYFYPRSPCGERQH